MQQTTDTQRPVTEAARDLARLLDTDGVTDAARLPADAGAYTILIELAAPVSLDIAAFAGRTMPVGLYVYAGSARGPGGLRARVARHLRRGKAPHWHVDRLTEAATSLHAFALPGGSECALVRRLVQTGRYSTPLPGFGSSDCRTCASHLLQDQIEVGWNRR